MPTYDTQCEGCQKAAEIRMSYLQYESVKVGTKTLSCTECQGNVVLVFNPGNVSFVLKDGESGGFASKALRENKYRARRGEVMAKRTKDHVAPKHLVPNHAGNLTGTWREAQEVARKEGGNASAATYEPLVTKERVG